LNATFARRTTFHHPLWPLVVLYLNGMHEAGSIASSRLSFHRNNCTLKIICAPGTRDAGGRFDGRRRRRSGMMVEHIRKMFSGAMAL
jgi:hypothetical protein